MAKSSDKQAKLRKYYVFDRLSLDKAAKLCEVHYTTAKRWKSKAFDDGDDWDKVKAATVLAGGDQEQLSRQILTGLLVALQSTLDLIEGNADMPAPVRVELLASMTDSMTKGMSALKRFLPEANALAIAMVVMRGLVEHIRKNHAQHATAFVEILTTYTEVLPKILDKAK